MLRPDFNARRRGLLCRLGEFLFRDQVKRRLAQRGSCRQRFRYSRILTLDAGDLVRGAPHPAPEYRGQRMTEWN